jgi:hypothetical protein
MECCKGCGPQETFVNCADIAIDDDGSVVSTPKPTTKTTPQQTTPKWTTPSPPTTSIQPETTTKDLGPHVTSCANDELLDCIGVGVYESLNYESWCNTYCSAGRPVINGNVSTIYERFLWTTSFATFHCYFITVVIISCK